MPQHFLKGLNFQKRCPIPETNRGRMKKIPGQKNISSTGADEYTTHI